MTETLKKVRKNALKLLLPPPRLKLSEWIESTVRLPATVSALPGAVRLWSYQREIADCIGDPLIERVSVVKPVRVGFTMLTTAAVAGFVANDPCPVAVVQPTESDARGFAVDDLEPMFEATPALRDLLSGDNDETGRSTLLSRKFPGGSLKLLAARSPRQLRRHTIRALFLDETSAYEVTNEGDPITLAERRTFSYANRKIVAGSTPVFENDTILRAYAQSDQRIFEVPCPECGGLTEIQWTHIEWEEGKPETAAFRCPHCSSLVDERHKPAMVASGCWRATRPEVRNHAGFRLNALISSLHNAAWGKLAAEFLASKDSPDTLQTFANTLLAQGWSESADTVDPDSLAARAEAFSLSAIPPEVLFVTVGCDVQADRIEATFCGWDKAGTLFILGHSVVWGRYTEETTWAELDELLRSTWQHPHGGTLRVDAALIDSGDGNATDQVMAFCQPRFGRKIVAGKGVAGSRPSIQMSKGKTRLFLVGVDTCKANLMNRLTAGRSFRLSNTLGLAWCEQFVSERRVVRYVRGQPVRRWERIPGRQAEALDTVVYGFAVRGIVSTPPDIRAAELASRTAPAPAQTVFRSKFLDR